MYDKGMGSEPSSQQSPLESGCRYLLHEPGSTKAWLPLALLLSPQHLHGAEGPQEQPRAAGADTKHGQGKAPLDAAASSCIKHSQASL